MKQKILTFILMWSALLTSHISYAYDFQVGGIGYTVTSFENFTVAVDGIDASLTGIISIPYSITYNNKSFVVTSIKSVQSSAGNDVESFLLPESITSIERYAFKGTSIIELTVPNSVTQIGEYAFAECSNLVKVTLSNNVFQLNSFLFENCTNLKEIEWHPSKRGIIRSGVFYGCSSLKSFKIPSGFWFTSSSDHAEKTVFKNCTSLDTLIIEDGTSPFSISTYYCEDHRCWREFQNCPIKYVYLGRPLEFDSEIPRPELDSVEHLVIGDNVTSNYAWLPTSYGGWGLKRLEIGSSLSSINKSFESNSTLEYIKIRRSIPPSAVGFSNYNYINTILYVPKGTKTIYESTDIWKNFWNIQEFEDEEIEVDIKKCANPTINYSNGKLSFVCETEEAICQASITDTDIKKYSGNEIQLGVTYVINVYATKAGYENSETVTGTLCWIDQQPTTEDITNNISHIPARAVLIQSRDGILTIQGVDDGSNIAVYNVSGQMVGSTKANGNQASFATNIKKGEVVIVKIGEKSVKVVMQ